MAYTLPTYSTEMQIILDRAELKYRYVLWMKHTKTKIENQNIPNVVFYFDNNLPIEMYVEG